MRISDWSSDVCSSDLEPGATVAVADHARLTRLRRRGPAQPGPAVGDVHAGGAVMFLELGVEHLAGQRDAGIDLPLHRARQPAPIALHLAMEGVVAVWRNPVVAAAAPVVVAERPARNAGVIEIGSASWWDSGGKNI